MIEWTITKGRGGQKTTEYIAISVTYGSRKEGEQRRQVCIRFTEQASRDLRLVVGDRLRVGIDSVTKQVCFQRTNEMNGSYKLTTSNKTKSVLVVQAQTMLQHHYAVQVAKDRVHHEPGHVAIDAPELFA